MCNETQSHDSVAVISEGYVATSDKIAEEKPVSGIICLLCTSFAVKYFGCNLY